jgi:hypothetical protein
MIAERIVWLFKSAPVFEQLRVRAARGSDAVYAFEAKILEAQPPEDEIVDDVMDALHVLASCRQVGMEVGRIPVTAIWEYWDRRGLTGTMHEIKTRLTLNADLTYLAERAKKAS